MPRFRFHIFNDDHTVDDEGQQFLNLDAARAFAGVAARGIMADELKSKGQINLSHWIEIEEDNGDMSVVAFGDVVKVER